MSALKTQSGYERWMRQAIELAKTGRYTTTPNPRVGCIIVDQAGKNVGQGAHLKAGQAHAEVIALQQAGEKAAGGTAYVTLEPCSHTGKTPPCVEALLTAKIGKVVIANTDPNPLVSGRGIKRLREQNVEVVEGVLSEEAAKLNPGFFKRMRTGRPKVTVKLACSLDGKTALQNGKSQWITGELARQDVQRHRAQSCAVLTGSGTLKADNPSLLVRKEQAKLSDYPEMPLRQPKRILVTSALNFDVQNQLFQDNEGLVVATCAQDPVDVSKIEQWSLPERKGRVDLDALIDKLGEQQMNEIWVEAGQTLAGAMINQGLVDELVIYMAPKLLGQDGLPLMHLPLYTSLNQCPQFKLIEHQALGNDIKLTYQVLSSGEL